MHKSHALLAEVLEYLWWVQGEVVVRSLEKKVAEDGDARPPHASRAVDENGGVTIAPYAPHLLVGVTAKC